MERANKKRILLLITNPFAAINVIHSGLLSELEKCYEISVMSDLLTEGDVGSFNEHFKLNMHLMETPVASAPGFIRRLRIFQTVLFGLFFDVATIRIKLMEKGALVHKLFCIARQSSLLIFLSGRLLIYLRRWLIRKMTHPARYASLAECQFDAVLSTSPLDMRENEIMNSLKAYGVRGISMIISWDNLTSKGIINADAGLVLVWSETMAREFDRFYWLFGDNATVRIVGVPRFDVYHRNTCKKSLPAAMRMADEGRATHKILFSTGAAKHHSCQNYIIDDLLEYAKTQPGLAILVRCHPADDPARYVRYTSCGNVRLFQPFAGNETPPADFLETLRAQLSLCRVCVQVASTMFLDAAACNTPVISIAYDARDDVPYAHSVRRYYDYSHHLPPHAFLQASVVRKRQELFGKLDEILETHAATSTLRNAIAPLVHHSGPDSVSATAQHIREWLG
ncbi:hypothetical protein [Dyadobacter fermentans]|uniref:Uncharacterized protein n=1 Tax=Dyadobacter fermentans (strain ATCC 700827 / DSM 18053 / CIP 107007 / KCTC 52180 / NS114) TaxID=471854 RepID=C6VS56_DYAFD|nr:hypothetical protein [Dyadobacter fermentans]ACT94577.1 hypothetical protein Dfer_3366 [Dyadobacter fermentans DSM 18053]